MKKNATDKKLSFNKTTLKNLTVRTGVKGGARPVGKCTSTCVPYGSAGTSTGGAACCTPGGTSY